MLSYTHLSKWDTEKQFRMAHYSFIFWVPYSLFAINSYLFYIIKQLIKDHTPFQNKILTGDFAKLESKSFGKS